MSVIPPEAIAAGFRQQYDTAFQISPIIFVGGLFAGPQLVPISAVTGFSPNGIPFARYVPVPGSTLVSQQIGMYPFANQAVAANATIQNPLTLSLMMIAPVNQPGGYTQKMNQFTSLQQTLVTHNNSGGMYHVATPAFLYRFMLLTNMQDMTSEENQQKQIEFQLDFIQPILTLQATAAQENALMQQVTNGTRMTPPISWSGTQAANPANLQNVQAALSAFGGTTFPNP